MGHSIRLESFDDSPVSQVRKHPEFQNGFEEGYAACLAEFKTSRKSLESDALNSISDINFTYQEARQAILANLSTIFCAISASILPSIALTSVANVIQKILIDAVSDQIPATALIAVHPSQIDTLRQQLEGLGAANFTLVPESTISQLSAWIQIGTQETCVDYQQVIDAVEMALNTFTQSKNEELQHG